MGELVARIVWGWRVFPTSRKEYITVDKGIELGHNTVMDSKKHIAVLSILETEKDIMTNAKTQFDSINTIKSLATAVHAGATALEVINTKVKECRDNGLKFGKSVKTCVNRATLTDSMAGLFKGKASKTYANYVTAIVSAVNDNIPFSFSASKGKAKGGKGGTPAEVHALLAKLFSHKGFDALVADFETSFQNDEGTLRDIIQVYLESEGYEIKE